MFHDIHKLHAKTGTAGPDFTKLFLLPSLLETEQQADNIFPNVRPASNTTVGQTCSPSTQLAAAQSADPDVPVQFRVFFCYECGYVAKSRMAWHNHKRTHSNGVRPLSRSLVDGPSCKICLRRFPTIYRHYHHLEEVSRNAQ